LFVVYNYLYIIPV